MKNILSLILMLLSLSMYGQKIPAMQKKIVGNEHRITDARYDAYCKMVEELNSEDNPVIMIVKLKK